MLGFRKRKQIDTGHTEAGRQLTLVFDDEMGIPKEDEYVFRYHAKRLPMLLDHQLSIELLHTEPMASGVSLVALFRNTLPGSFDIDELPVLLLDEHNVPLGRKILYRVDLPQFEPWTSKPVYLDFQEEDLFGDLPIDQTMRLVFQMNPIDPLQTRGDACSPVARRQLLQTNVSIAPVGENEFNLMLVAIERDETTLTATLLLRNGYNQDLNVEQLPLELVSDETVVGFTTIRLEEAIQAKHAYPVSVVYEDITGDGPFTVRLKS